MKSMRIRVLGIALLAIGVALSSAPIFAGAIPGVFTRNGYVDPQFDKTDTFFITFRGGEKARIRVRNLTNRGDINLHVYNLDGKLIDRDTRTDDDAYLEFHVPKTTRYRVVVRAVAGNQPLRYRLTTN